jgi:1,2-diacylglycerol 3-alpha-glucosyltransferase
MRVAILFDRFGPYHIARLEAATKYVHVIPIEIFGETNEYQWNKVGSEKLKNRITLFENKSSHQVSKKILSEALKSCFDREMPEVVAINGWYAYSALVALKWCLEKNVPAVVVTESGARDFKRVWWRELLKRKIIRQFSGALVGGIRHADYLARLGMDREKIFFGYDVVDNNYFEERSNLARQKEKDHRAEKGLPENYFLVVSRFIEKKNIPFVIKSYSDYLSNSETAWNLVILGDGPLESQYVELVRNLKLENKVSFRGFKQYDELPIYFGLAKAFIHASTSEQWGLVVNEAMASGLPVIISEPCGCVPELVHHNRNGFVIDPSNKKHLTAVMLQLSGDEVLRKRLSEESKIVISAFGADAFGKGLFNACNKALQEDQKKVSFGIKLLIHSMANR